MALRFKTSKAAQTGFGNPQGSMLKPRLKILRPLRSSSCGLRNLLADRFQLKLHRDTVERTGYALVQAKSGLKLKESSGDGKGGLRITGANIFKPDAIERKNLDQNTMTGQRT